MKTSQVFVDRQIACSRSAKIKMNDMMVISTMIFIASKVPKIV